MGRAPFELHYENDRLLHADSIEELREKLDLKVGEFEERNGDSESGGGWPW